MTRPHGPDVSMDRPVVKKTDPKSCARCGLPTRHRCKECLTILCALCLPLNDVCAGCHRE